MIWFIFENHNTGQVAGHSPYMNRIAARCGLLTNLTAVAHPSLPNYLALTSGSTHKVADDGPPSSHPIGTRNLFEQASRWRTYAEGMPRACSRSDGGSRYAVKHNPAAYYTDLRRVCAKRDQPLSNLKADLQQRILCQAPHAAMNIAVGAAVDAVQDPGGEGRPEITVQGRHGPVLDVSVKAGAHHELAAVAEAVDDSAYFRLRFTRFGAKPGEWDRAANGPALVVEVREGAKDLGHHVFRAGFA